MVSKRRIIDLLPSVLQTQALQRFTSATADHLFQPQAAETISGYIGRYTLYTDPNKDFYIKESTQSRQDYSLEPIAISRDSDTGDLTHALFYDDLINHLRFHGGNVTNHNRLFDNEFFSWCPPIDIDKIINFKRYYWMPSGPGAIELTGITDIATNIVGSTDYPLVYTGEYRLPSDSIGDEVHDGGSEPLTLTSGMRITIRNDINAETYNDKTFIIEGVGVSAFLLEEPSENKNQFWDYLGEYEESPYVLFFDEDINEVIVSINGQTSFTFSGYYKTADTNSPWRPFDPYNPPDLDDPDDELWEASYAPESEPLVLTEGQYVVFANYPGPQATTFTYHNALYRVTFVGTNIKLVKEVAVGWDTSTENGWGGQTAIVSAVADYIVMERGAIDGNPWSRYNRWFHESLVDAADRGTDDAIRAERPIIEFTKNLELYNYGESRLTDVDVKEDILTYSQISGFVASNPDFIQNQPPLRDYGVAPLLLDVTENGKNWVDVSNDPSLVWHSVTVGSNSASIDLTDPDVGTALTVTEVKHSIVYVNDVPKRIGFDYRIDGNTLTIFGNWAGSTKVSIVYWDTEKGILIRDGLTILLTGDPNPEFNNRIYQVSGIQSTGRVVLTPVDLDNNGLPAIGATIRSKYGFTNLEKDFQYDGDGWVEVQRKSEVNQPPLFALYDINGVSLDDPGVYPDSNFEGSKLFGFTDEDSSAYAVDSVLGMRIKYNDDGQILYKNYISTDRFTYGDDADEIIGYYFHRKINEDGTSEYSNDWYLVDDPSYQRIKHTFIAIEGQTQFEISHSFQFDDLADPLAITVIVNSTELNLHTDFGVSGTTVTLANGTSKNDLVTIYTFSERDPVQMTGVYEIPLNLQANPDWEEVNEISYNEFFQHFVSILSSQANFDGNVYGQNNFRDTSKDRSFGRVILQHRAPLLKTMIMASDQDIDPMLAMQYADHEYGRFRNKFLRKIVDIFNSGTDRSLAPSAFVDRALAEINVGKTADFAFAYSTMVPAGENFISLDYSFTAATGLYEYTVPVSSDDLENAFVYLQGPDDAHPYMLDYGWDYEIIDDALVFQTELSLTEDHTITLVRYSGYFSFVPPTPSAMGIYAIFRPEIITDETLLTPRQFIQAHDGSFIDVFSDEYEDLNEVVLEFERRIYNGASRNFSERGSERIFDHRRYVSGKFRKVASTDAIDETKQTTYLADYTWNEWNDIIRPMFERWAILHKINYRENLTWISNNPFTWNYSSVPDRDGDVIPGHWRGIYLYYFDTDRPNTHPWEMVGLSQKPVWWDTTYGIAPYTRGNSKLWQDMEDGIIADGSNAGEYLEYKRPGLSQYIPVDDVGNLLDPVAAGIVAYNPTASNAQKPWKFGDHAPSETAWRRSANFPFSATQGGYLIKPVRLVEYCWDTIRLQEIYRDQRRSRQWVYNDIRARRSHSFLTMHGELSDDIELPERYRVTGVQQWVSDYVKNRGQDVTTKFGNVIRGIGVRLGHKMAGFINENTLQVRADNFGLMPSENINVFLYRSPSIADHAYSGVVVEWTGENWKVFGYDTLNPFFNIIAHDPNGRKTRIAVGRPEPVGRRWIGNAYYNTGDIVQYNGAEYKCISSHRSTGIFEETFWSPLNHGSSSKGIDAVYYLDGNRLGEVTRVPYGTVFYNQQDVFNFLQNYGRWLVSDGWVFEELDYDNVESFDWTSVGKDFLFWSLGQWAPGSTIALSPSSKQLKFVSEHGEVQGIERITRGSYSMLNRDGFMIQPNETDVSRMGNELIVTTRNEQLIYLCRLFISEVEHVIIFDNETIFSDLLYDPIFNLRQPRLRIRTTRSSDWNGRIDAPGFIVTDNLMVANFEKTADDFRRFYGIEDGVDDPVLSKYALHLIGYENRAYMNDLLLDPKTQLQFFQGAIRQKGTTESMQKLLRSFFVFEADDVEFYDEWAFRVGNYGGLTNRLSFEFLLRQREIRGRPQLIEFREYSEGIDDLPNDDVINIPLDVQEWEPDTGYSKYREVKYDYKHYKVTEAYTSGDTITEDVDGGYLEEIQTRWMIKPNSELDTIFPNRIDYNFHQGDLPLAGYVRVDEADHYAMDLDDLDDVIFNLLEDGDNIEEDQIIWIYDVNDDWQIYKVKELGVIKDVTVKEETTWISFNEDITVRVGDIIIVATEANTTPEIMGVHTVIDVLAQDALSIDTVIGEGYDFANMDETGPTVYKLSPRRFPNTTVRDAVGITWASGDRVYIDGVVSGTASNITTPSGSIAVGTLSEGDEFTINGKLIVVGDTSTGAAIETLINNVIDETHISTSVNINTITLTNLKGGGLYIEDEDDGAILTKLGWSSDVDPSSPAIYNYSNDLEYSVLLRGVSTWSSVRLRNTKVETPLVTNARIYNKRTNKITQQLNLYDPAKGVIPGLADAEIWYKIELDPAVYNNGDSELYLINEKHSWGKTEEYRLWWDLSTIKFLDYEISDNKYRKNVWGTVAPRASIDIYEWTRSRVPPTEWAGEVETNRGLPLDGFDTKPTGEVRNAENPAWCERVEFNQTTGETETFYYFWVKNKTTVPPVGWRKFSSMQVARIIENPTSQDIPWFSPIADDAVIVSCIDAFLDDDDTVLQVNYRRVDRDDNVHRQWILQRDGDSSSVPDELLWRKMRDSLIGFNDENLDVPDPSLSTIEKYGTLVRPRQTWFADKTMARQVFVEKLNQYMASRPITTLGSDWEYYMKSTDRNDLILTTKSEKSVLIQLDLGDAGLDALILTPVDLATTELDDDIDLSGATFTGTIDRVFVRNGNRVLVKNQTNKILNGIYVYNSGSNTFSRDSDDVVRGSNVVVLRGTDNRDTRWTQYEDDVTLGSTNNEWHEYITDDEYHFEVDTITERNALETEDIVGLEIGHRVLVNGYSDTSGFWTIWRFGGDEVPGSWVMERIQSYKTEDFFTIVDWYADGYSQNDIPKRVFETELARDIYGRDYPYAVGEFIKIHNKTTGYWYWQEYLGQDDGDLYGRWVTVAIKDGTIEISDRFYDSDYNVVIKGDSTDHTYDDIALRDGSLELKQIFLAIDGNSEFEIESILTDFERNQMFFSMVHYAHSEHRFVDWAFKTSFLYIKGINEPLLQEPVLRADHTESIIGYINEIKPYHSKIRDFSLSRTLTSEEVNPNITDFDKPIYPMDRTSVTQEIIGITWNSDSDVDIDSPHTSDDLVGSIHHADWYDNFLNYNEDHYPVRNIKTSIYFDRTKWVDWFVDGEEELLDLYSDHYGIYHEWNDERPVNIGDRVWFHNYDDLNQDHWKLLSLQSPNHPEVIQIAALTPSGGKVRLTTVGAHNVVPSTYYIAAPLYDTGVEYSVGDIVTHSNYRYRCTTAYTSAGEFDPTNWDADIPQDYVYIVIPQAVPELVLTGNGRTKTFSIPFRIDIDDFEVFIDGRSLVWESSINYPGSDALAVSANHPEKSFTPEFEIVPAEKKEKHYATADHDGQFTLRGTPYQPHQLSAYVKRNSIPSTWVTATEYSINDVVQVSDTQYVCVSDHTSSGDFVTDSAKWEEISGEEKSLGRTGWDNFNEGIDPVYTVYYEESSGLVVTISPAPNEGDTFYFRYKTDSEVKLRINRTPSADQTIYIRRRSNPIMRGTYRVNRYIASNILELEATIDEEIELSTDNLPINLLVYHQETISVLNDDSSTTILKLDHNIDDQYLSQAERIMLHYAPTAGMPAKDIRELLGINYSGSLVDGGDLQDRSFSHDVGQHIPLKSLVYDGETNEIIIDYWQEGWDETLAWGAHGWGEIRQKQENDMVIVEIDGVGTDEYNFRPNGTDWEEDTVYEIGDAVVYEGVGYYASVPEWNAATEYSINDKVKITDGDEVTIYVCLSEPVEETFQLQLADGDWQTLTEYNNDNSTEENVSHTSGEEFDPEYFVEANLAWLVELTGDVPEGSMITISAIPNYVIEDVETTSEYRISTRYYDMNILGGTFSSPPPTANADTMIFDGSFRLPGAVQTIEANGGQTTFVLNGSPAVGILNSDADLNWHVRVFVNGVRVLSGYTLEQSDGDWQVVFDEGLATGDEVRTELLGRSSMSNPYQDKNRPQELLQTQIGETLGITVYTEATPGSPGVISTRYTGDGVTTVFNIGNRPASREAVFVAVNDMMYNRVNTFGDNSEDEYKVNWDEAEIEFDIAPLPGHLIKITSFTTGGTNLENIDTFTSIGIGEFTLTKEPAATPNLRVWVQEPDSDESYELPNDDYTFSLVQSQLFVTPDPETDSIVTATYEIEDNTANDFQNNQLQRITEIKVFTADEIGEGLVSIILDNPEGIVYTKSHITVIRAGDIVENDYFSITALSDGTYEVTLVTGAPTIGSMVVTAFNTPNITRIRTTQYTYTEGEPIILDPAPNPASPSHGAVLVWKKITTADLTSDGGDPAGTSINDPITSDDVGRNIRLMPPTTRYFLGDGSTFVYRFDRPITAPCLTKIWIGETDIPMLPNFPAGLDGCDADGNSSHEYTIPIRYRDAINIYEALPTTSEDPDLLPGDYFIITVNVDGFDSSDGFDALPFDHTAVPEGSDDSNWVGSAFNGTWASKGQNIPNPNQADQDDFNFENGDMVLYLGNNRWSRVIASAGSFTDSNYATNLAMAISNAKREIHFFEAPARDLDICFVWYEDGLYDYDIIDGNELHLYSPTFTGLGLVTGDVITVTTFADDEAMGVRTHVFTAIESAEYPMTRIPWNADSMWVNLNGRRSVYSQDYTIKNSIYGWDMFGFDNFIGWDGSRTRPLLNFFATHDPAWRLVVTTFANQQNKKPVGFRLFKDASDDWYHHRISDANKSRLSSDLDLGDLEIHVEDASRFIGSASAILKTNIADKFSTEEAITITIDYPVDSDTDSIEVTITPNDDDEIGLLEIAGAINSSTDAHDINVLAELNDRGVLTIYRNGGHFNLSDLPEGFGELFFENELTAYYYFEYPQAVFIEGERIEFSKVDVGNNKLLGIRRGSGSSPNGIKNLYRSYTEIADGLVNEYTMPSWFRPIDDVIAVAAETVSGSTRTVYEYHKNEFSFVTDGDGDYVITMNQMPTEGTSLTFTTTLANWTTTNTNYTVGTVVVDAGDIQRIPGGYRWEGLLDRGFMGVTDAIPEGTDGVTEETAGRWYRLSRKYESEMLDIRIIIEHEGLLDPETGLPQIVEELLVRYDDWYLDGSILKFNRDLPEATSANNVIIELRSYRGLQYSNTSLGQFLRERPATSYWGA